MNKARTKYVSELLGKGTIDKKSSGETKGRQGSSSRNYDVLGRELFTPDEVRKLDNKKCIIFIRGFNPVVDNKFVPFTHPAFNQTADGKGKPYVHKTPANGIRDKPGYRLLGQEAVDYYERLKAQGKPVFIDQLSVGELKALSRIEMEKSFLNMDRTGHEEKRDMELYDKTACRHGENTSDAIKAVVKKAKVHRKKPEGGDSLMNRMAQWHYSEEQKAELHKMTALGIPKKLYWQFFILKQMWKYYGSCKNVPGGTKYSFLNCPILYVYSSIKQPDTFSVMWLAQKETGQFVSYKQKQFIP